MNFQNAAFVTSYGLSAQLPEGTLPEIAFAGRSNVGKSSMLNRLFQRKSLARVSAVPGKTATINYYRVDGCYFVDLPGYGYAKVSQSEKERWASLMGDYFEGDRPLRLVVLLMDVRHPPTALDVQMAEYLWVNSLPFVIVLTKCDKLKPTAKKERLAAFPTELPGGEDLRILPFSAETGEGMDAVKACIIEALG